MPFKPICFFKKIYFPSQFFNNFGLLVYSHCGVVPDPMYSGPGKLDQKPGRN